MTNDKKAAQASTRTAPKSTAVDSRDSTANDPLQGWFALARRNVARYSLATPEWPAPGFGEVQP